MQKVPCSIPGIASKQGPWQPGWESSSLPETLAVAYFGVALHLRNAQFLLLSFSDSGDGLFLVLLSLALCYSKLAV